MTKKILALLIFLVFCVVVLTRVSFGSSEQTRLSFQASGEDLYGAFIRPRDVEGPYPVVVFVHGDGPLNYDAYGYYRPIWEALAARGIASFSWDKPGVGGSSGDWLDQDMDDRAEEVAAAIKMLAERDELVVASQIGVIGFSQAGWVLPLLPDKQDRLSYMVFVSTAIDWMQQSRYQQELRGGITKAQRRENAAFNQSATYEQYSQNVESQGGEPMSEERFGFAKKNWRANATQGLSNINVPTLAVFGGQDMNVDVENSIDAYRDLLGEGSGNVLIKLYPEATHSLTKADYYNTQSPGYIFMLLVNILGEDFFVDGFLSCLSDWALQQTLESSEPVDACQ